MMHRRNLILSLLFSLLVVGCGEKVADVENPNVYHKNALKFRYPKNWTIESDSDTNSIHAIQMTTSGDGIVIIQGYDASIAWTIEEYAKIFKKGMSSATTMVDFVSKDTERSENKIKESFNVKLLGQEIAHVRVMSKKTLGDKIYFIVFQVPAEDETKTIKGYELIESSFSKG